MNMQQKSNRTAASVDVVEPLNINPFSDALGIMYAVSYVLVAFAAWQTGTRPVIGCLPLWAIVWAIAACGCVLMHLVKRGDGTLLCPLVVTWAFLAIMILAADVAVRIYPKVASLTPLADKVVLQWAVVVLTIAFGAVAVFTHFQSILKNYSPRTQHADTDVAIGEVSA